MHSLLIVLFIGHSVNGIVNFVYFFSQDEIFDMVKPTDPYRITLQDLISRSATLITRFHINLMTRMGKFTCTLYMYKAFLIL